MGRHQSLPFVTQGIAIALSPDGQTLAMACRGNRPGTTRLATMDLNGANYRELTLALTNDTLTNALTWSRDGQSIFLVDRGERAGDRMMRVSTDGGTPVFTGVRVAGIRNFDISPDGTRLIYGTSNPEGAGKLHSTLDVKALLAPRP
jgi:Tol biopolymer transport system component